MNDIRWNEISLAEFRSLARLTKDESAVLEDWAELTNDWLEDDDAVDGKAEVYYREIVKH